MAGRRVTRDRIAGAAAAGLLAVLTWSVGCTGGSESNAAVEQAPPRESPVPVAPDALRDLRAISAAIPVYPGASFREDLTRRDEVMVVSRYGSGTRVFTLATDDSFPQVYHYYTAYLAQFRAFPANETVPPLEQPHWRTFEVLLNDVMQDPFIPGASLDSDGSLVLLQVAETEAEPPTVVRYIVLPRPALEPASNRPPVGPVSR